jgi:hypothetical protein
MNICYIIRNIIMDRIKQLEQKYEREAPKNLNQYVWDKLPLTDGQRQVIINDLIDAGKLEKACVQLINSEEENKAHDIEQKDDSRPRESTGEAKDRVGGR